jgi:uncharacterized membrane protein
MINMEWIGIGILLVIMGTMLTYLLGNVGSVLGFVVAITIVAYMINTVREKRLSLH